MLQIRSALSDSVGIGATGEIILLTAKGEAIQILAHQDLFDRDHDHPDMVLPGSDYYDTLRRGLLGELVVSSTVDDHQHEIVLAFSPVAGTDWTVATERHTHELTEPFIQAGIIGGGISLLFIFAGGFYNYRIANQIEKIAISAEQKAELKQRQLEEALDVMNDGFALFDKDDRLVLCNQVYREIYSTHAFSIEIGKSLEEILRAGCSVGAFPQAVGREEDWIKERLVQHQATETIEQKLADGRWLKIS